MKANQPAKSAQISKETHALLVAIKRKTGVSISYAIARAVRVYHDLIMRAWKE